MLLHNYLIRYPSVGSLVKAGNTTPQCLIKFNILNSRMSFGNHTKLSTRWAWRFSSLCPMGLIIGSEMILIKWEEEDTIYIQIPYNYYSIVQMQTLLIFVNAQMASNNPAGNKLKIFQMWRCNIVQRWIIMDKILLIAILLIFYTPF